MFGVHELLNERKQSIDQKYHSLIKDFEKYIDIPRLRDEAIRYFYQKLSKVSLSLPEYNVDDLRLKMEHLIPDVIFSNFLTIFYEKVTFNFSPFF